MLRTNTVFLVVLLLLGRKTKKKSLKLFKIHHWNDKEWKLEHTKSQMKPYLSGLHQCVVTTFQSMVLFLWGKLMNLLRPSFTTILQHQRDGWEAGRKGKWYFPWVLICSSNQNNVRWITTFFLVSLDMVLLSNRSLGSQKRWLKRWLHLGRRQPYQQYYLDTS